MAGELARNVLKGVASQKPAKDLNWNDRGRLIAVETPAAIYVGTLTSFSMYAHDALRLYIERGDYKSDFRLEPDAMIFFGEESA